MNEVIQNYALPSLWAALASFGFTYIYNIHGFGKIICGFGGGMGWLVYLLGGSTIWSGFVAAAVIGVFSEIMARVRRSPVTAYLLVSLLPLVPGGGIYYAMSHCVAGETDLFITTLLHTFGMAAALAVGAMLASSLFRTIFPRFPRFTKRQG